MPSNFEIYDPFSREWESGKMSKIKMKYEVGSVSD